MAASRCLSTSVRPYSAAGARWLDISVRPGAGGSYTLLTPRQKLNPAPYALSMPNVFTNESRELRRRWILRTDDGFGRLRPHARAPRTTALAACISIRRILSETLSTASPPAVSARAWTEYIGSQDKWALYNGGYRLFVPSGGGLEIATTTTDDGLRINTTADDGIQVGGAGYPNYGVYIPAPGVPN